MDPAIYASIKRELLACPSWHVFYLEHPKQPCFVVSDTVWFEHGCPIDWTRQLEAVAVHAEWILNEVNVDINADDCALRPFILPERAHHLLTPDQDGLAALADKIRKTITLHRIMRTPDDRFAIKRLYAVRPT